MNLRKMAEEIIQPELDDFLGKNLQEMLKVLIAKNLLTVRLKTIKECSDICDQQAILFFTDDEVKNMDLILKVREIQRAETKGKILALLNPPETVSSQKEEKP
jgi:hypothetical protein